MGETLVFFSIREKPFSIYGLYRPETEPVFRRLPEDTAKAVSDKFSSLSRQPSGGCIRFSTDSPVISVRANMTDVYRYPVTPPAMAAGFDLYEDTDQGPRFIDVFFPDLDVSSHLEMKRDVPGNGLRFYTLYFPLRATVSQVEIGVAAGSVLSEGRQFLGDKPIVVYGSSIVQGVSASRPGMIYPSILSRRLNRCFINLGYAGAAHAEVPVMEYMASMSMSVFVYDYDHNSSNAEDLRQTHYRGYRIIRDKNPKLPVLLITRPNASTNPVNAEERKAVILETFRRAHSEGDTHIYYIDGKTFFTGKNEYDCTSDRVHPTDLGYSLMADGIEPVLLRALAESDKEIRS